LFVVFHSISLYSVVVGTFKINSDRAVGYDVPQDYIILRVCGQKIRRVGKTDSPPCVVVKDICNNVVIGGGYCQDSIPIIV
jgi:hypothetical protein